MIGKIKLALVAAAASGAMFATAANAGTFVTSITITSAIPTYLQVAELEAFSNGVNVAAHAAGATATDSSEYAPGVSTADKAIDGNTGGDYYSDTIFHSAGAGSNEYLTVTLGTGADISSLSIFGRTDCCGDRDVYKYTLFNGSQQVGSGTLDASNSDHTATASVAAVPETATWAMMLAGFGMIGFAARRRQSVNTTVRFA